MFSPEEIANQQALLATHRRTLAHLLQQAVQYGGLPFAPPQTANGIGEARAEIQRIKASLRADGVAVEDAPDDESSPQVEPIQSQRTIGMQLNAHGSQGSIGQVSGAVSQNFGEQTNIDTGGGAYISGAKIGHGHIITGATIYGDVIGQQTINQAIHSSLTPQERRNRSRMLQKVRDFWVKGVLEKSLYNEVLIELGMETRPDAVAHPWDMLIQQPDREVRPLSAGTRIVDIFDEMGGELLILGAPGAGKTTMLLDLARDLITRAEQDEGLPIPVVFNLSSWAEKRASLTDWLIDELNTRYDVPRKIGKAWVDTDALLLLLDGLDEVKQEQSVPCVEAINRCRQDHGLANIVVCSRVADYEALTARLKLQGAVLVQPLTAKQIDAYLASAGEQLVVLHMALVEGAPLRELAESPLMLSIMTLAYRGWSAESLPESGTIEEQRKHLFAVYIERMFARRSVEMDYTREQTIEWLMLFARGMIASNISQFYIEYLQPLSLVMPWQQRVYSVAVVFVIGLVGGLVSGLFGGLAFGLVGGFQWGLIGGLFLGLSYCRTGKSRWISIVSLRWSWPMVK